MKNTLHTVFCTLLTIVILVAALRFVTHIWLLSLVFSFQLHIAVLAIVASLLILAIRRTVYGGLLLAASIALAGHAVVMKREFSHAPPAESAVIAPIRLMHFNILNENTEGAPRIVDAILASGADVVTILEADPIMPFLETRLAAAYPYRIGCGVKTPNCDLLVLSRQPFVDSRIYSVGELRRDRFAIGDIAFAGRIVHIAAAHLSKPYFDDAHEEELEAIADYLKPLDGPMVMAGDFNSEAIAPDMQNFLRLLGFRTAPYEPPTWPIRAGYFGIAIDHVFVKAPLAIRKLSRIEDAMGSNHYGLMADLALTAD